MKCFQCEKSSSYYTHAIGGYAVCHACIRKTRFRRITISVCKTVEVKTDKYGNLNYQYRPTRKTLRAFSEVTR
jgi:hypothetical protein